MGVPRTTVRFVVVATGLGVVVLLDVLRVFLPSVITIFGQAASTPAELLGLFALVWFLLALAGPALCRVFGASRVFLGAGAVLALARVVLQFADGGQVQLYAAAIGLLAGLLWLVSVAVLGSGAAGFAGGLIASAVLHGALGTVDLVWRGWWPLALLEVALFVAALVRVRPGGQRAGWRVWALAMPAVLLAGVVALSPAVAAVAVSYAAGSGGVASTDGGIGWSVLVPLLLAVAAAAFVAGWLTRGRVLAVALVAGVAVFVYAPPGWLPVAVVLSAAGLGGVLGSAAAGEPGTAARRGYGLALGGVGMAVAAVLYYASYDLGFDNRPVLVVAAVAVAVLAGRPVARPRRDWGWAALAGVVALVAVSGGTWSQDRDVADGLRVVAYNVRMGFGLDGRFDPDEQARVVAAQEPDVVLLSEVDRGWLLNGGHDDLMVLARRLGMRALFAPAADAVWGDAVLTRLPVVSARTVELPPDGPTGAQALGVVLDTGSGEIAVVSTHFQPGSRDGVEQARATAGLVRELAAGRPLVLGGDLNAEPGDEAYRILLDAGLTDALAAARPLPTSPADDPRSQIDHLLVTAGLTPQRAEAPRSTASDHLPVAVTLVR